MRSTCLDVPDGLDRAAVERTFDKYLADWRSEAPRRASRAANYTPYEIRIIGALVRLGRREAALELLRFFLSDRRPPPWNQWPEIAWRDRKAPAHVGDLPHTWIAAEYVLAVRSLFAYEIEARRTLVLAAGLSPEWLEGEGVEVKAMPTLYGPLSYSLRRIDARTLRFDIATKIDAPLILRPPLGSPLRSALVNGTAAAITRRRLRERCPYARGSDLRRHVKKRSTVRTFPKPTSDRAIPAIAGLYIRPARCPARSSPRRPARPCCS